MRRAVLVHSANCLLRAVRSFLQRSSSQRLDPIAIDSFRSASIAAPQMSQAVVSMMVFFCTMAETFLPGGQSTIGNRSVTPEPAERIGWHEKQSPPGSWRPPFMWGSML